jgi:hypothetical protein
VRAIRRYAVVQTVPWASESYAGERALPIVGGVPEAEAVASDRDNAASFVVQRWRWIGD